MPTLTAGNSAAVSVAADQTVSITILHGSTGRIQFVASNAGAILGDGGAGRNFGPLSTTQTFGPWAVAGTVTVFADSGSVDYTVNASAFQDVTVANTITVGGFAQTAGTLSSTGTGTKTVTASGTGNVVLGATGTGESTLTRVNTLSVISTDSSGTPGAATINNLSGRAAFAAAASTCVITNSKVAATSKVFVSLGSADATLTSVRVTPAAGSFTVTGNAAATATTVFDFLVVN
ncbi:MAG: hypothetical protein WCI59_21385 [Betaproteobacteria bacterium]|jgi:hypothetical protein